MKQISQELYDALQKEFGTKQSRFIDNGDGTVTDTKERLMWEKTPIDVTFTWAEAMERTSNLAGYSDWRLPTIHELFTLVDFSEEKDKLIDDVFDMGKDQYWFWSSTTSPSNASHALGVHFDYGNVNRTSTLRNADVRLVRQIDY